MARRRVTGTKMRQCSYRGSHAGSKRKQTYRIPRAPFCCRGPLKPRLCPPSLSLTTGDFYNGKNLRRKVTTGIKQSCLLCKTQKCCLLNASVYPLTLHSARRPMYPKCNRTCSEDKVLKTTSETSITEHSVESDQSSQYVTRRTSSYLNLCNEELADYMLQRGSM